MFSTILREVTGYFDRRSLLSAFLPSLVFWATTLIVWIALTKGLRESLAAWEKQGRLTTGLLLLTFLIWCAFWSFLTLNLRAGLTRVYEGYWPFARMETTRRTYWRGRYDEKNQDDFELEQQEINLSNLFEGLLLILHETQQKLPAGADQEEANLDKVLDDLEKKTTHLTSPAAAELEARVVSLQQCWQQMESKLRDSDAGGNATWLRRHQRLDRIIRRLKAIHSEVEEKRQRFNRNFNMYFPPDRDAVMPTRLGNVLKAAEVQLWRRYHLDAVLIWSRLQPDLPKEFAESLQDSRMALDMMLTLSGFTLFFGLIQSLSLAIKLPLETLASAPLLLLVIVPVVARYVFGRTWKKTLVIASATIVLIIVLPLVAIAIMLKRGFWVPLVAFGDLGLRVETLFILMVAFCLFSWLIYLNAVQAALVYGEKVQSSFDLYRWRVLEGLHLQLPPNFADERKTWEEVGALLSASKEPDARYYRYVKQEQTKEAYAQPQPTFNLPVPVRDLPPYHVLANDDVVLEKVSLNQELDNVARKKEEVIGKETLSRLRSRQAILLASLTEAQSLESTVAIGIPATPAALMGSNLQAGDLIDLIVVPAANQKKPPADPIVFENILVLNTGSTPSKPEVTDLITVAMPVDRRLEFAASSVASSLFFMKRL